MYPFPRLLPFDAGRRARARSGSPVVRRHYRTDALRTSEPSMCEERRHVLEGIQDLKMFYDQGLVETHGTIPALRKSIHGILRQGDRAAAAFAALGAACFPSPAPRSSIRFERCCEWRSTTRRMLGMAPAASCRSRCGTLREAPGGNPASERTRDQRASRRRWSGTGG